MKDSRRPSFDSLRVPPPPSALRRRVLEAARRAATTGEEAPSPPVIVRPRRSAPRLWLAAAVLALAAGLALTLVPASSHDPEERLAARASAPWDDRDLETLRSLGAPPWTLRAPVRSDSLREARRLERAEGSRL